MLFAWLRNMVRESILGGVDDAVAILHGEEGQEATPGLAMTLRRRLALPHVPEPETKDLAHPGATGSRRKEK